MNNFYPQTFFDNGPFSGTYRSDLKKNVPIEPENVVWAKSFIKGNRSKIEETKVSRNFQADRSTFRGLNRPLKMTKILTERHDQRHDLAGPDLTKFLLKIAPWSPKDVPLNIEIRTGTLSSTPIYFQNE